jgi:hypothetical protein
VGGQLKQLLTDDLLLCTTRQQRRTDASSSLTTYGGLMIANAVILQNDVIMFVIQAAISHRPYPSNECYNSNRSN